MIQIIVDNKKTNLDIDEPIWLDDTASMVKQKLAKALKTSIEEMYLYLETTTTIIPQEVYKILLTNRKNGEGISVDTLKSFCANLGKHRIGTLDESEPVSYEMIEKMFADKEYSIKIPFGVMFSADPTTATTSSGSTILPADPFMAPRIKSNKFLVVSTNEETILSKVPQDFRDTVLHVCTVSEAIASYTHPGIGLFVSLYYPKLADKLPKNLGVAATPADYLETIRDMKKDLLKQSESLFKTNTKYYNNVSFWNTHSDIDSSEVAGSVGFTNLTATYLATPNLAYPLPIDYLFKSFHATARMPFVRHVISKRREQMIRLYAPQEAEDDKRIPDLPRAVVNKIIVKSKKTPGLGVFIRHFGPDIYLFLELKENGYIQVQLEAPDNNPITPLQLEELAHIIAEFVAIINEILKQTDITLTTVRSMKEDTAITDVDWIHPFRIDAAKDIFSQTKAKLGCSVFLPESVVLKEQGKREKEAGPAKTKQKAAKLKTEMEFIYTRVSNFSVDIPEELQTKLKVYYSVDTHQLYMKVTNIPRITYLMCLPTYLVTFMKLLTDKDLEGEYKDTAGLTSYGYNKQKGEEALQAQLLEELKEKEATVHAEAEEEEDELEKFLAARLKEIPEAPEDEVAEEGEELGEFELEEGEEDEELGEFDLEEGEDEEEEI
jgi:hypothetical protein